MEKSEIMNCAAILAAGIIANEASTTVYDAESAVALMNEIAKAIRKQESDGEREYPMI